MDKVIWMYWEQGLDDAPEIVVDSYNSWRLMNSDYKVIMLDKHNLDEYLDFNVYDFVNSVDVGLGKAGVSDLIRLLLLSRYGGVWADATTYCLRELNSWLDISDSGFFCFRQPKKCMDRQMASWFIASEKNGVIIRSLLEKVMSYLSRDRGFILKLNHSIDYENITSQSDTGYSYLNSQEKKGCFPYFWMFYLFNETVKEHKDIWARVKKKPNKYSSNKNVGILLIDSFVLKSTHRVPVERYKVEVLKKIIYDYKGVDNYLDFPGNWMNQLKNANIFESQKVVFYDIPGCLVESIKGCVLRDFTNRVFNKSSRINLLLGRRKGSFEKVTVVRNPISRFFHILLEEGVDLMGEKSIIDLLSNKNTSITYKPMSFFIDSEIDEVIKAEELFLRKHDSINKILYKGCSTQKDKLDYPYISEKVYNKILEVYDKDFDKFGYAKVPYRKFSENQNEYLVIG